MSKVTLVMIGLCTFLGLLKDQPSRKNRPNLGGGGGSMDSAKLLKTLQGLTGGGEPKEGLRAITDLVDRSVIDGMSGANLAGALMGVVKPEDISQPQKAIMIQQILGDIEKKLENEPQTSARTAVAKLLAGLLAMDCGLAKHADEADAGQCAKDGVCHAL